MSNFLKEVNGVARSAQVQGTDIGSGAATNIQVLIANGSGGTAFGSITAAMLPTITLTGNVTGSASGGSISTTIANSAVTLSMLANLAANSAIANITGSSATPTAVSMLTTATANAIMIRDANANIQVNNLIESVTTTATSGTTTTLTVSSTYSQQFTGTTTQTVVLPNAATLSNGQAFAIFNRSTGVVTVNANGGGLIQTMAAGSQTIVTLINNGTSAGVWDSSYSLTSGGGASNPTTFGTRSSPLSIVAANGLVGGTNVSTTALVQVSFVQGSGGAVTISASPAIAAGTIVGQELIIIGRSNTNTVTIPDQSGLVELNGKCTLGASDMITLVFDGTAWVEQCRNN